MKVFDFVSYKEFVQKKLDSSEKRGFGQYSRIAQHLNIHTSMVSQVFKGSKQLTFEQACGLCSFFGFNELEADYFIALVQLERAGTQAAVEKCKRDLQKLKQQADLLSNRLTKDVVLKEEDNVFFYSHWYYTAIKLLCSISGYQTAEAISEKLNVPLQNVRKVIEFLLSVGLCVEKNGNIRPGPANTHLSSDSPLVSRHHQNWRVKGFEKMSLVKSNEIFLTMPATLTKEDSYLLRKMIVEFTEKAVAVIDNSKGEILQCLNIDWFEV